MGKSDSIILPEYIKLTSGLKPECIAFLGFSNSNAFTDSFNADKEFYDLSNGWNINDEWSLRQTYDLIACTRCPYFSRDPVDFLDRCRRHLNPGGRIFLDWGLGDHWRFKKYKVGWVRDVEHEYAYVPDNFLYSCLWRKSFEHNLVVQDFWNNVRGKFGYSDSDSLDVIVRQEVPKVIDYEFEKIKFKFLWPDLPQLYIMTLI